MEILLIIPKYSHMWWIKQPPLGALYTATLLENEGYKVDILDLRYREHNLFNLNKYTVFFLITSEYDLTQCYPWDLSKIVDTVAQLKIYQKPILAVGPHCSINAELTMKELKVDGVLKGENELVIPSFLKVFDEYKLQKGFIYEKKGKIVLDQLPIPNYDLVDLDEYESFIPSNGSIVKRKTGLIFANRGCPYNCEYCYNEFFGNKVRFREVDKVVEEIIEMKRKKIENFFFLDYTFTVKKEWVYKLLPKIKDLNISWGCETRVDCVDNEILNLMAEAGCKYIWYGIESPQIDKIAKNKSINREYIDDVLHYTLENGIQPMTFILVGFPNENISDIYDWCKSHECIFDHSVIFPRPGTKLYKNLLGNNKPKYSSWFELEKESSLLLYKNREEVEKKFKHLATLDNYFDNIFSNRKYKL